MLSSSVDNPIIKEGGSSILTYTYDHQYTGGDEAGQSTGQRANITVQMKRGVQVVFTQSYTNVAKGSYSLDISKYLLLGTTDIYVKAEVTDIEGKKQTKQAYSSVKVVTLALSTSYNLANKVAQGGYGTLETVSIPFTVSGAGTKSRDPLCGRQAAEHTDRNQVRHYQRQLQPIIEYSCSRTAYNPNGCGNGRLGRPHNQVRKYLL